ncbi:MAG: MBL fold metallo-hydrolase [Burkholderiales bacterium]|nr:MBL fold metallo-hydrolase [Burkholderiales bacterium]
MRITFLGAAGEVTGSSYLVEADAATFLVDCGLFQGGKDAAAKNFAAPPFDVRAIDFVVVTHAHLDHSGLLPRLVALGYRNPVYCTPATADLLAIMLRDSAYIHEKEAAWAAARPRRGTAPRIAPLYTIAQAEACLPLLAGVGYREEFKPRTGVRLRFDDAGHILGAAIAQLRVRDAGREVKLVFSGDLGQPGRPVVRDPTPIEQADVLLVESTYGNRDHKGWTETVDELIEALADTLERRRGNLIVPAFALGRTQELIALLAQLAAARRVGRLNVFVDSPLACAATQVTLKHADLLDAESRDAIARLLHGKLPVRVRFTEDVSDSKKLNLIRSGAVIIAASGMCDAGRIKHHLEHNIARRECSILFTGFQAEGTLGRRIVEGARSVRIYGESLPVRARVYTLGGLSAHADRTALLGWLGNFRRAPREVFVVHGEAEAARSFAQAVRRELGWRPRLPAYRTRYEV